MSATDVQLLSRALRVRSAGVVSGPRDLSDVAVHRLLVDVPLKDLALLEQYATYMNKVAEARGTRIKRQWSKKSLAEDLVSEQCDTIRRQLASMFDALGPFPEAPGPGAPDKDKDRFKSEMQAYAERAVKWAAKTSK